jgi:tetratricopeptide (TPR) repeat protein
VSHVYFNFGIIYKNRGDLTNAIEYYNKAALIRINVLGVNHPIVGDSFLKMANCYIALYNYNEALRYYQKAYGILKKEGIAFQIAQCYEALNDKETALDYYIQSAEIRKEDIGLENEATQEAIINALRLAKELGKHGELPEWMR